MASLRSRELPHRIAPAGLFGGIGPGATTAAGAGGAVAGVGRPRPAARWGAVVPSWPLWLGLFAFVRVAVQPLAVLNDPDTYLHIAAGRWIIAHLALPAADPFSFSRAGAHWVPGEWLAETILATAYRVAGWSGIALLSALCLALTVALLGQLLVRRIGALPGAIATLAGLALVLPHALARPHLLAMPVLVLWSGALIEARDRGRAPSLWLLPVMALWANLHASFLFGLGLAVWLGAEAVAAPSPGRSRRAEAAGWGAFAAAGCLAALWTPNGIAAFVQPLRLMAMPALQSSFGEWLPPDFAHFPALEWWLLAALALGLGAGVRVRPLRLALLLVLVHMALRHVRHADLLGLVGPLLVAGAVAEALAARPDLAALSLWRGAARLAGPLRWPALAATAALALTAAAPIVVRPLIRPGDAATPAAAVAEARRLGLAGPVFNGEAFGGYLAFAGVPDFIDGRIEMFGDRFLAEDVAAEGGDPRALARILARYRIGWTLLAPQAGAVALLDRLPGWRRVYGDRFAVIHARIPAAAK